MEVTKEQIEVWKKDYRCEVYEIEVEGYKCYIRSFDRSTMKCVLASLTMQVSDRGAEIDAGKMLEIGEIGFENCRLACDEEILTNDRLYIAVCMQVGALFEFAQATLKKV